MQAIATAAAHRAIQFPGLFARSSNHIQPIKRHVPATYANQVRDTILRCTRQMSGIQSQQIKAKFLQGVEVQEIELEQWMEADEGFQPVWFV